MQSSAEPPVRTPEKKCFSPFSFQPIDLPPSLRFDDDAPVQEEEAPGEEVDLKRPADDIAQPNETDEEPIAKRPKSDLPDIDKL